MLVKDEGPPCNVFLSASASCCTWIAYCNSCLAYSRSCMSFTLTCVGSVAQFVQNTMPLPTWALAGFIRSEPAITATSNLRINSPCQHKHLIHFLLKPSRQPVFLCHRNASPKPAFPA